MRMAREALRPDDIRTVVRGDIPADAVEYGSEKLAGALRVVPGRTLGATLVFDRIENPSVARPFVVEASVDVGGMPVRAQVAASTAREAVDLLVERLRRRLDRIEDRMEARHRWLSVDNGEWRRGAPRAARPEYFPRPPEERRVVRRKSFAVAPMTVDEAAFDMDLLDHAFYLFVDERTGRDVVVHRVDGGYGLIGGRADSVAGATVPVHVEPDPPTLDEAAALERLDAGNEDFVFFIDAATGRGRVVYRRYDGDYGVIEAV